MKSSAVGRACLGLAVAAGLSVAVVGCSTQHSSDKAAVERREKAVNSVDDLRTDLKRADAQVVTTQQSLQRLSTQQVGDLKPTYNNYVKEISRNRSINESLDGRSRALSSEASKHVNEWYSQANTIQTDSLRQKSLERERQARREQDETLRAVNDVRGMYSQYIGQLNDIATYAANDLTPSGLAGMRDQVQRSEQLGQDLRNRMAQLDVRLDRLATAWATDVPLAAAAERESAQPAGGTMPPADRTTTPPPAERTPPADRMTTPPPADQTTPPSESGAHGM